jgi:hypothetical protein
MLQKVENELSKQANQYALHLNTNENNQIDAKSLVLVDSNGNCWISQRALGKLFKFTSTGTISKHIKSHGSAYILNEFNQLSEDSLLAVSTHYAQKGNVHAIELLGKFAKAGVKVFMYGMANKEYKQRPDRMIQADKAIEFRLQQIEYKQKLLVDENNDLKHTLNGIKVNTYIKRLQHMDWVNKGWLTEKKIHHVRYHYDITALGRKHLQQYNSHIEKK